MGRGDGWFRITLFNGRSCSVRPSQHLVVVDRHAEESLSFFSTITCHVRLVSLAAKREEQKEQRVGYRRGPTVPSKRPNWREGQTCILFECVFSSNNAAQRPRNHLMCISQLANECWHGERKKKKRERERASEDGEPKWIRLHGRAGPLDDRYWPAQ